MTNCDDPHLKRHAVKKGDGGPVKDCSKCACDIKDKGATRKVILVTYCDDSNTHDPQLKRHAVKNAKIVSVTVKGKVATRKAILVTNCAYSGTDDPRLKRGAVKKADGADI